MANSEPIEYEIALKWAEVNKHRAVAAVSAKLQAKEDRFLDHIRRAKVGPYKKLEILYLLMDELSASLSKFTPCKMGCSSCCHYKVSVSEVEVTYIEKNTKYRRLKNTAPIQDFHGKPCPFLKAGACSIYSARPFVCRRHSTLTPNAYWCHHERSDQTFPLIGFTNVAGAFDQIRLETNAGEPYDIRQLFGGVVGG